MKLQYLDGDNKMVLNIGSEGTLGEVIGDKMDSLKL